MGMITPEISYNGKTVIYCADLVPSSAHIPVHYTMGYDIEPLVVMKEKEKLYAEMDEENTVYFFEHDLETECARLARNDRGQMVAAERGNIADLLF
jgi:hypothetical protein